MNIARKYRLLRVVAFVLKLLAWLVLIAGILALVAVLAAIVIAGHQWLGEWRVAAIAGALMLSLAAVVWFVQLFSFGSILSLLIDVEENTRAMAVQPPA